MDLSAILTWNVRGLNQKARRDSVRALIAAAKPQIVCLQETKVQTMTSAILLSTLDADYDGNVVLPAEGTRGGILIAWFETACRSITTRVDQFSASVLFQNPDGVQWWFTGVYGPQPDAQKVLFMNELRMLRIACQGPWAIAGDFNLIYRASDKNNHNIDRAMMGQFRRLLNELVLKEVELLGRTYTWSNEREAPTLVRLDRVFCTSAWEDLFPGHMLHSTAAGISDHCPLVLTLNSRCAGKPRFHFESFWPKMEGFHDIVQRAWHSVPNSGQPIERLHEKLRATTKALQSWSQRTVGNVRLLLDVAREALHRLDMAQDVRGLTPDESWLRRQLK